MQRCARTHIGDERRVAQHRLGAADAARRTTDAIGMASKVSLLGMGLGLVGAEAIVGTLAARALVQGPAIVYGAGGAAAAAPLQALDVLVVQANTNTLMSCFCGLLSTMRLRRAAERCAASADE